MKKFEIKEIEILNSKVRFYKLINNGRCLYDEFEEEIIMNGNYQDELDTIQAII